LEFGPLSRLFTGCVTVPRAAPKADRKDRIAVLAPASVGGYAISAQTGTPFAGLVFDCEPNFGQDFPTFVARFINADTVQLTNP
jgi:hypothetical protein